MTDESGPRQAAPAETTARSSEAILDDTPVTDVDLARRWHELGLGCTDGCPLDHHEHDWPSDADASVDQCNYCTSLDWSAREGLTTCWSVCPLRAGAS
jgi:hypothetical protein